MFPFIRPGKDGHDHEVDQDDHGGQGGGDHIDQDNPDDHVGKLGECVIKQEVLYIINDNRSAGYSLEIRFFFTFET